MSNIRVRFPPSPTGYFHAGSARTALFNWLFARHHHGKFIVRIEDTDRTRFHEEALTDLTAGLRWLGLDWDEGPQVGGPHGPYFQSERLPIYQKYAQQLVDGGFAYTCYCSAERLDQMREEQQQRGLSPGYDRHCRDLTPQQCAQKESEGMVPIIRLKVPLTGETHFQDLIRGEISMKNSNMDDFVLLKSDGFPTYHLANVVDDHLMEISHIMRGDEWIPSTPRHVLMYQAFGWTPPIYGHLPVILDPSGKGKMSKRKTVGVGGRQQNVLIHDFRAVGYLPEAMFNYLSLLGWSYDATSKILTPKQIIEAFDLEHVSKAPAAFNYEKLDWMNGQYIRQLPAEDLGKRIEPFLSRAGIVFDPAVVRQIVPLIQERMTTLADAPELVDVFFVDHIEYAAELLIQKNMTAEQTRAILNTAREALEAAPDLGEQSIEEALRSRADAMGLGAREFFGTIRVATTGKKVAPPLFGTLAILGRERVLARIMQAQPMLR